MALSGASMVGVATKILPPAPGGEQTLVDVEFKNCISIGPVMTYPETGAFLSVDRQKVEEWIRSGARILSFDNGSWINLDGPKEKFFDSKLNRIESAEKCIERMRQIFREHPEIERGRTFARRFSAEEAKRLGVEAGAFLLVPCDNTLEKWAIQGIESKDWIRRMDGIDALRWFESPANKKRLLKLTTDPFRSTDRSNDRFPVRERAMWVLENWSVKVVSNTGK